MQYGSNSITDSEEFVSRIDNCIVEQVPVFNELITLKNNAFLERDFLPVMVDNQLQDYPLSL
jgi:hypothetical protein